MPENVDHKQKFAKIRPFALAVLILFGLAYLVYGGIEFWIFYNRTVDFLVLKNQSGETVKIIIKTDNDEWTETLRDGRVTDSNFSAPGGL